MSAFLVGHATHPDWRSALALAAAQVDGAAQAHGRSGAGPLTLGFVYFTDHYAAHAAELLAALRERWPRVAWVGAAGVGVAAAGVEYIDEPALALMLGSLPQGRFEVFSGAAKLHRVEPWTALVHADPATPDLAELVAEMSDRTLSGYLFGGLSSSRAANWQVADGLWQGGLSGVAFTRDVALVSRVTQGCQPLGPTRRVTACERHLVLELDGRPALPLLLADLGLPGLDDPRAALPRLRATLAGLSDAPQEGERAAPSRHGAFGAEVRVRHLVGLDPGRHAVAVAEMLQPGMQLAFCQRDVQAARRDLVRICSEIREELEPQPEAPPLAALAALGEASDAAAAADDALPGRARRILGALYISCAGRGGAHFGGPSAELKIVQHALGGGVDGAPEVPLVGFFAGGEIAHHRIYGYTGVLTVFTARA
jgi:small ligand-binding sensory domain FIST